MIICISIWVFAILIDEYKGNEYGVRFQEFISNNHGWAYQGHLDINAKTIKLNHELRGIPIRNISRTMQICGYYIHHENTNSFPFMVIIIDKKRGNAEIQLKSEIKFEDLTDRYTFQIEAYDCDQPPHFSERKFVLIEIGSVNGPNFLKTAYQFTINSSLAVGTKIGEIVAIERPIGGQSTQNDRGICKYEILSPNPVPFSINKFGSLYTKELPLIVGIHNKYRFYIRATDCDIHQPRQTSVPVIVDVYDSCTPHWTGLNKNIKYIKNDRVLPLVEVQVNAPKFHVCTSSCSNFEIILTARLHGEKLKLATPDNCKHDSASVKKQSRLCGESTDFIDLMKNAPKEIIDYKTGTYFLNFNYVPVEINLDNSTHFLGQTFSLVFWMKHGSMKLDDPKQQIICNSDSNEMNRHHYSLFLHNCKLVLLIRKEHWESTQDKYQPTEWRYGPLKEVCDNKWHHYAIIFNEGNPTLQIDGEIYQNEPFILIERPLHKLSGNIQNTKFTVGSCYHSKTDSYVQNFIGYLSGVKLLKSRAEAVNTVRCMATCGEALLLPHIVEIIDSDSSVTIFSQYSIIRSHNINDLLLMFSKLSYINTNEIDDSSTRNVTIDTEIKCDSGQVVKVPQENITLGIVKSKIVEDSDALEQSSIYIFSQSRIEGYLGKPILLFPNVKFIQTNNISDKLKSCIIRPITYPIGSWEFINWPVNLALNHHFTSINNSHGLILEGNQSSNIYESIIRQITFETHKNEKINFKRKFGLICAIDDKIITNEITITVSIKVPDLRTYYVIDDPDENQNDVFNKLRDLQSSDNRQGFEDKLVILGKNQVKSNRNKLLWVLVPIGMVLAVGVSLVLLVYFKKYSKNARSWRKSDKNIKMQLVGNVVDSYHSPDSKTNEIYDKDTDSIISDCPESCGEQEFDEEDDHFIRYSDEENINDSRINITISPKYRISAQKVWDKPCNGPVDV